MGRYSGWRRLTGDTADRPDLLDLGKKLLGELENQRNLSGIPTRSIQRRAPDGSIVAARYVGDLPEIFVRQASGSKQTIVSGFFGRPTTAGDELAAGTWYGTWWSESADRHVPLAALSANGGALEGGWYDADNAPDGAPPRFYARYFPDSGLRLAANIDWTGDKGVLYFFGPENRYNDPATYYTPLIYHNGALLVDMQDVTGTSSWRVIGAALHGALELRMVLCRLDELRVYRIPLASASPGYGDVPLHLHPRLTVTYDEHDAVDAELLAEYELAPNDAGYRHPLHFNQRGDECRGIFWRYDVIGDRNVPYEVVIGFTDDGLEYSTTDLPYSVATVSGAPDSAGSVSLETGSMVAVLPDTGHEVPFPSREEGGTAPEVPSLQSIGYSLACAGWTAIAVDYRDNVPVYLEVRGAVGSGSGQTDFERTVNAGSGQVFWDALSQRWSAYVVDGTPGQANVTTTIVSASTHDYVPRSVRTDWLQLDDLDQQAVDTTTTTTTDVYVDPGNTDPDATITGSGVRVTTASSREHTLIYLDLRHKLACYQVEAANETRDDALTEASGWAGPNPTGGTTTDFVRSGAYTRTIVLDVAGVSVESDAVESIDLADTGSEYSAKANPGLLSAYHDLISSPVEPDAPTPDLTYLAPQQLESFQAQVVRHDDFGVLTAHAPRGAWAVSQKLVAYSYSIQPGGSEVSPDAMTAQRHGFCTTAGKRADATWPGLTGADDASSYLRYSPICAISPFTPK